MPTRFGETQHGFLAPTPKRQAAFVGATLGVATLGALPPGIQTRLLDIGVKSYAAVVAMGDAYPALGSSHKFGIRYGGTGEVTTLGRALPVTRGIYGPIAGKVPFPDFGFGLTAVPVSSSRWVYENNKSRPGEHTSRSGTPQTSKSMLGASAPKTRKSTTSSKKGRGSGARLRVSRGHRLRKSRRTVPWCPIHKRRHLCRFTRKR